jgi:hypothetical protein
MSGLQCWDAGGNIIVDLGDYNMRYMGSVGLNVAAGTTNSWAVGFGGMQSTGWLVVPQNYYNTGYDQNIIYCIPGTNAFTAVHLPVGYHGAYNFTFDVYKWSV